MGEIGGKSGGPGHLENGEGEEVKR